MKIAYFIQTRMGSKRLPGKMLKSLAPGMSMAKMIYSRTLASQYASNENIFFLTTKNSNDDVLVNYFEKNGWYYFRGEEQNVFNRFYEAALRFRPDYFFRICGDNPFLEPRFLDRLADAIRSDSGFDYISFQDDSGDPVIRTHYGYFAELIGCRKFLTIDQSRLSSYESEHVTPVFYENEQEYRIRLFPMPKGLINRRIRLTVDTSDDLERARRLFAKLKPDFHIEDVYSEIMKDSLVLRSMEKEIGNNKK